MTVPNQGDKTGQTCHFGIVRYWEGRFTQTRDPVVVEQPLHVFVNGAPRYFCVHLPGRERELAAGLCFSEGIVKTAGDIDRIDSEEGEHTVRTQLACDPEVSPSELKVIRSSSGALNSADLEGFFERDRTDTGDALRLPASRLFDLARDFSGRQEVFRETGGPHAVALYATDGVCVAFAEDVGRHNALDTCIGSAVLSGDLGRASIVICSSRLGYEMVAKACRTGVEIMAGVSAPTSLAVAIARRSNLTLVGFLRKDRFNIYSRPERISGGESE